MIKFNSSLGENIEFIAVQDENTQKWMISTEINDISYKNLEIEFCDGIKSMNSVSNMFKYCPVEAQKKDEKISMTIDIGYLDNKIVKFDLYEQEHSQVEVLSKRLDRLTHSLTDLNQKKTVRGYFSIYLDRNDNYRYKIMSDFPDRFETLILNSYKEDCLRQIKIISDCQGWIFQKTVFDNLSKNILGAEKLKDFFDICQKTIIPYVPWSKAICKDGKTFYFPKPPFVNSRLFYKTRTFIENWNEYEFFCKNFCGFFCNDSTIYCSERKGFFWAGEILFAHDYIVYEEPSEENIFLNIDTYFTKDCLQLQKDTSLTIQNRLHFIEGISSTILDEKTDFKKRWIYIWDDCFGV